MFYTKSENDFGKSFHVPNLKLDFSNQREHGDLP